MGDNLWSPTDYGRPTFVRAQCRPQARVGICRRLKLQSRQIALCTDQGIAVFLLCYVTDSSYCTNLTHNPVYPQITTAAEQLWLSALYTSSLRRASFAKYYSREHRSSVEHVPVPAPYTVRRIPSFPHEPPFSTRPIAAVAVVPRVSEPSSRRLGRNVAPSAWSWSARDSLRSIYPGFSRSAGQHCLTASTFNIVDIVATVGFAAATVSLEKPRLDSRHHPLPRGARLASHGRFRNHAAVEQTSDLCFAEKYSRLFSLSFIL
jgi:hypothetical protein